MFQEQPIGDIRYYCPPRTHLRPRRQAAPPAVIPTPPANCCADSHLDTRLDALSTDAPCPPPHVACLTPALAVDGHPCWEWP